MSDYRQLAYVQRCQIEALKKSGLSQQRIADLLGIHQSTVSRELSRNTGLKGYRHKQAQEKADLRRSATHIPSKMTGEVVTLIDRKLGEKWSPEQISGWLLDTQNLSLSHESVYRHVWADKQGGGTLYKHLRRRGKKYQWRGSNGKTSRGQIKNRVSIDDRPAVVDEKIEVGHWEIDTMIGKGQSGALVTIVERVTRFTVSKQVKGKSAKAVTAATLTLLTPFKNLVRTITSDNGKEFARHETIAAELDCQFYFAHPYHSWERGLNENTNGLLRQYFPKSTDFKCVRNQEVVAAVNQLNQRPRKVLAFKTPFDLMEQQMAALAA